MLEARHLSCERGGRILFRGLSFSLQAGQSLEIRGRNGSGKSRLLRILAGITSDWSGQLDRAERALYLGHENGLHPKLTVLENLDWLASLHGAERSAIQDGLTAFEVTPLAHRPCETLSVGQQRRAALARLVFDDAKLWILDEPTNSLDATSEARFHALLAAHIEVGGSAVIATHAGASEQARGWPCSHVLELGGEQ
ncbi:MAG: heme ABC exporter ATP-binding protein CcmA [Gammaproteobacteria bacterium]|nr:heme ABC exporter ATP-binding protein CcmA [Gammaproteobacteria bacterium]MCY4324124.1 heme ABC exporter ATP-binding protein CcmA [Gammaproteobacteria bacterium]